MTDYWTDGQIQYTGPVGRVERVGSGIHYTQPFPGVTRRNGAPEYWQERHRLERKAERRANPDYRCFGTVAPYGTVLVDGRGNRLLFSQRTHWQHPGAVPLQIEHEASVVGHAIPINETNALVVDATIYSRLRKRVGDRCHLSIGLGPFTCRERDDGILEVVEAELREVSLVEHARWAEHTAAAIWERAA